MANSGKTLTPRQRVEMALRGEATDKRSFTVYESRLPRCAVERELRNRGLCVVDRSVPVLRSHRPDVKVVQTSYVENGKSLTRIEHQTPVGTVTEIHEPAGFTSWCRKHVFSGPEDYKPLIFMIDNEAYEPAYEAFTRAEAMVGEDVILRGGIGLEPMQAIISSMMGTEQFCMEWMERRDEVLRLYEANVRAARRRYKLLAESPCWHFNYGGNVTVEVIGPKVFEDYYLPHYLEAGEILHRCGKLIGCHLDANNKRIAGLVAQSGLDYIEAFTPAPDTDMTLSEAFKAWPGQCLWINFPSSIHLASREKIAATTRELLDAARDRPGFIIGITEDVPEDRWQESFLTIMDAIDAYS